MRKLLLITSLWLLASAAWAQTSLKEIRSVEGITEYTLPNGLTILLQPDASKPSTSVNITYRVGSRHEAYGESGAAHLLEHLLFKASETIADPKQEMTRRGARWNGTTGYDRTNYFAQFTQDPETLDWMLGWLAESMTRAKVAKEDLATEMTVVRNEMERAENNPGRVLGERMRSVAYQWHAYGRDVLGARSDIENMPIERLQAFYRKHYRPDNAVLLVGGKFDAPAVLKRIEQTFGPIAKPTTPLEPTWTREPTQDGERQVLLRRTGGASSVAVLYHAMPGSTPEFAALRVLAQVLRSERGPLEQALVQPGLAATQWSFALSANEPGFFMAGAGLKDGPPEQAQVAAQRAADVLAQTLASLQLTQAQVDSARTQMLQGMEAALREPEAVSLAISESVALGDWRLLFVQRDWVAAVTLDDVQRVARTWLRPSNRTTGMYLASSAVPERTPAAEPASAAQNRLAQTLANFKFRAPESPVEDFELTAANIESRLVKSRLTVGGAPGLQLVVLPRQTKGERVTGTLRLRWGTTETVAGSAVLAGFAGSLLVHGTAAQSAEQIKQALLALDATVGFSTGPGGLSANFELPAKNTAAFMRLLAELLTQATLPDAEFERQRTAALANFQGTKADTAAVAGNALQQVFANYPQDDPRASLNFAQREALLRSATAAQVRAFYKRFASAAIGEMALIGPVQPGDVQAQLQHLLGGWTGSEPRKPWVYEYPASLPSSWQSVQVPDKANANYTARIPFAMNDDAPDYPALFVGIQLLGGRAGTALWKRVREDEGLSYGVNSSLVVPTASRNSEGQGGQAAAINITASFAPQNRDKLREVIRDEVTKRAASGFSSLEVGFARRAILSNLAGSLAQPGDLAARLANNLRYGRDMSRYTYFKEAYEKLDADAVNAALRKHLDVSRLVEAAAGSFAP